MPGGQEVAMNEIALNETRTCWDIIFLGQGRGGNFNHVELTMREEQEVDDNGRIWGVQDYMINFNVMQEEHLEETTNYDIDPNILIWQGMIKFGLPSIQSMNKGEDLMKNKGKSCNRKNSRKRGI